MPFREPPCCADGACGVKRQGNLINLIPKTCTGSKADCLRWLFSLVSCIHPEYNLRMSRDRNDPGSSMPSPSRRDFTFPGVPSSALRRLTSWLVVGFWTVFLGALLWTSFYAVPADSVGIVQRFGRYVHTEEPGLRFKIPFGMDAVMGSGGVLWGQISIYDI